MPYCTICQHATDDPNPMPLCPTCLKTLIDEAEYEARQNGEPIYDADFEAAFDLGINE